MRQDWLKLRQVPTKESSDSDIGRFKDKFENENPREALKGERKGQFSIRINDLHQTCALEVAVPDIGPSWRSSKPMNEDR